MSTIRFGIGDFAPLQNQRQSAGLAERHTDMRVTARTDGPVSIAYEIVGAGSLVVFLWNEGCPLLTFFSR